MSDLSDFDEMMNNVRTMLWCPSCEDWFLRSQKYDHEHSLQQRRPENPNVSVDEDGGEQYKYGGDEPMEVGGVYDVELTYEYVVRERVVAPTEYIAKEMVDIGDGHITHKLWSDTNRVEVIYEDDDRAEEHDLTPL